jgi:hypothetical protein
MVFAKFNVDPKGWFFSCRFFSLSKFDNEKYVKKNEGKRWALVFRGKTCRF